MLKKVAKVKCPQLLPQSQGASSRSGSEREAAQEDERQCHLETPGTELSFF